MKGRDVSTQHLELAGIEPPPELTLDPAIQAILRTRTERMSEACASVLRVGWQPSDCLIEHHLDTKRDVLVVRGVPVFELVETWTDTTCHLEWRWLAEIPEREGYTIPQA